MSHPVTGTSASGATSHTPPADRADPAHTTGYPTISTISSAASAEINNAREWISDFIASICRCLEMLPLIGHLFASEPLAVPTGSVIIPAPWCYGEEPDVLPEDWLKHTATRDIYVRDNLRDQRYNDVVLIPNGDNYFTYRGAIAIGFHGTYNPPCGM